MNLVSGVSVSSCGDKVWACWIRMKIKDDYISKLMMYDFKKNSHFLYDYEHQDLIVSVLISEAFSLAMSGGLDRTLVLHGLKTGKTIKKIHMRYGYLQCLFDLGSAVAVGDQHTLRFFDLETREMDQYEVRAEGDYILCMNLGVQQSHHNDYMALLLGGIFSNKIDKISIPKAIVENGRDILEMRNQTKNKEKFKRKMIDLENENKRLLKENQLLKQKLMQEKNRKVDLKSKYVKKLMILSNQVKSQKIIKAQLQLQQDLNQLKNELISLKSKKIQSNPAKRHLLIYQVIKKNRDVKGKSNASNNDSDKFSILDNSYTQGRVEELKKRIRQRQAQIENLHREIDDLQNREDHHQILREEFGRLDGYVKRMTRSNTDIQNFW